MQRSKDLRGNIAVSGECNVIMMYLSSIRDSLQETWINGTNGVSVHKMNSSLCQVHTRNLRFVQQIEAVFNV